MQAVRRRRKRRYYRCSLIANFDGPATVSLTALFSTFQGGRNHLVRATINRVLVAQFHHGGGFQPGEWCGPAPPAAGISRTPVDRVRRSRRRRNLGRNSYSFLRFNIGNGHNVPFGGELESIAIDSLWKRFVLGHGVRFSLAAGVHCDTVGQSSEPRHEPLSG